MTLENDRSPKWNITVSSREAGFFKTEASGNLVPVLSRLGQGQKSNLELGESKTLLAITLPTHARMLRCCKYTTNELSTIDTTAIIVNPTAGEGAGVDRANTPHEPW